MLVLLIVALPSLKHHQFEIRPSESLTRSYTMIRMSTSRVSRGAYGREVKASVIAAKGRVQVRGHLPWRRPTLDSHRSGCAARPIL